MRTHPDKLLVGKSGASGVNVNDDLETPHGFHSTGGPAGIDGR